MTTTTSYGTWSSRVSLHSESPEQDVDNVMSGGGSEWYERMEQSGALARIRTEYRAEIDAVMPDGVSLCGNEFYGPAHEADIVDWSDILDQIEGIDLAAIIDRHDVDNAQATDSAQEG